MEPLLALLVPIIIVVVGALILIALTERFSPDPTITLIIRWVVFAAVLIYILKQFIPLLGYKL